MSCDSVPAPSEAAGIGSPVTNRGDSKEKFKKLLRSVPLAYGCARRLYRLFRKTDPTLEERILSAIGNRQAISFVQVGSNDGLHGDPIHDLIVSRTGWRGMFIEPVDFLFRRLRENYGNAERFVFENVAIGTEKRRRQFYYVSEQARSGLDLPYWHDQLGSFDRRHILRMLGDEVSPYIIETDVECVPLQEVLDRNRINTIDLLHIDTEGFDYQVLAQVDFKRYKPAVILFEHHLLSDEEFGRARALLRRNRYRLSHHGNDILAIRRSWF